MMHEAWSLGSLDKIMKPGGPIHQHTQMQFICPGALRLREEIPLRSMIAVLQQKHGEREKEEWNKSSRRKGDRSRLVRTRILVCYEQ